ncbi:MAG: hypothetical protein COS82_00410 [Zetaproteobacteria bacterium CG06_land_8_20_14_3_00_59_53]|nr:MAG: hypothetical protein AUK36_05155 [Zetaproteobacteria bacterium CG2_30_59_37]PIO90454.1 MAG: hypothetical protein COX56_01465 [Zetaproteobacteria bacterium CG23_combo_of_CG06-09_8_20_14_all_59_86]PIQ65925.1 MAG: hypothetical protein COV97_01025 [Zetaproteobacteria bacterium CG11_big_fil_rev_8_21_14_0_20_59_439]PIU71405.1 MAG: hypothetical protein COS82_00410 [Zetaproteobacteria bacterium CG06_land_8_20_14_3_00_59_53]PIU97661.1 MAG: hypothetical protein COS62_01390 [Zetaproteobacteria bac
MARPKYQITPADSSFARRWIEGKLSNPAWLGADRSWQAHQNLVERIETAVELNAWCVHWLDSRHWAQLKNAVRAARKRAKTDDTVSVTLSRNAWGILSYWAERDACTLSGVIEQRLGGKQTNDHACD